MLVVKGRLCRDDTIDLFASYVVGKSAYLTTSRSLPTLF